VPGRHDARGRDAGRPGPRRGAASAYRRNEPAASLHRAPARGSDFLFRAGLLLASAGFERPRRPRPRPRRPARNPGGSPLGSGIALVRDSQDKALRLADAGAAFARVLRSPSLFPPASCGRSIPRGKRCPPTGIPSGRLPVVTGAAAPGSGAGSSDPHEHIGTRRSAPIGRRSRLRRHRHPQFFPKDPR
jgi:hypothetical protein